MVQGPFLGTRAQGGPAVFSRVRSLFGVLEPNMGLKLSVQQHRLCSVARGWRSRSQTQRLTSFREVLRGLLSGQYNEGEPYILVF